MGLITEYKCPGCGAPLAFDAESGQVTCQHCGNVYTVADVVADQKKEQSTEEFDWGNYKAGLSTEVLDNTVVYQCKSCGAVLETDANTAATSCPYCDNNIVITDRVSSTSRVETTLSLARKPLMRDVTILQSPRPTGFIIGETQPAITARMLAEESST